MPSIKDGNKELRIRELEGKDFSQVREIDDLTLKAYMGASWDKYTEEKKETIRKSRKSEFDINVNTGYCLVAEQGNRILGFILAHETLPFRGTVYIRHIAVRPDFQSQGVGEKLLTDLINKARKKGISKVWGGISVDNPSSIRLHEKVGFRLVDRKMAYLNIKPEVDT